VTDSPALRYLRKLRIVAVVLVVLFVAGHFLVDDIPWLARAAEWSERVLVFGLVGVFSLVLLAFVWQFFADLIHGRDDRVGRVILELRRPRNVVGTLVSVLLLVWLVGGLATLAILPEDTLSEWNLQNPFAEMTPEFMAFTALFAAIAAFLIVAFTVRGLRNPAWFLLGDLGFVYRPGDVSAGVVRWSEIREIKASEVLSSSGRAGPELKPVMVVSLKHPERYNEGYNPLLRQLIRRLTPVLAAQTGGGDLFLDPADFGADYERVLGLMREHAGLTPAEH